MINLLSASLTQITKARQGGLVILLVGVVLGVWSLSGSMQTLMWGLNVAFQRQETRGFVRRRLIALAMVGCTLVAFAIVFVLFVLAPRLSHWAGEHLGYERSPSTLWTVIQWPVVIIALLLVFAMLMRLGPDLDEPGFHPITIGGVTAVLGWLVLSDVFAYFTSRFGSYNKTWGSLAAVIVVLVWLRLSALVLLFGAELNAERAADRARRAEYDAPSMSDPDIPSWTESHREQRLVKNEMAFRAHNERRAELEEAGGVDPEEEVPFVCECGNPDCTVADRDLDRRVRAHPRTRRPLCGEARTCVARRRARRGRGGALPRGREARARPLRLVLNQRAPRLGLDLLDVLEPVDLRSAGNFHAQMPATAIDAIPPRSTAGTAPISAAATPDSNAPSSLEAPMNTRSTAPTRPRSAGGVSSGTSVPRIDIEIMSAPASAASAAIDSAKLVERPNTMREHPE